MLAKQIAASVVQAAAEKRDCLATDANGTDNYEHKGKSALSVARCKRYHARFPGCEVHRRSD